MLLMMLLACGDKGTDSDQVAPPLDSTPTGTTVTCNGTAPVLESVTLGNAGIVTGDDGDLPGLLISLHVTDVDGDVHRLSADIWYDDQIDGVVDVAVPAALTTGYYLSDDDPCEVFTIDFNVAVGVNGTSMTYNTQYEVAAVVLDDAGLASAPGLGMGYTPNSDGTDGGG